ncbi:MULTISPECIES: ATP-binding protein [unclassified Streptomyces]|uniref:ATP-binding protein n=1 Tax=unclassified Streptomyces TaxID=2593676 RepID=UPI0033BCD2B5
MTPKWLVLSRTAVGRGERSPARRRRTCALTGPPRPCAGELVTNAVRYGTEPGDSFKVSVAAAPGRCRVEVHDTRRRTPRLRPVSDQRVRGRRLHLVEALASRWGVAERPFGKIVRVVVTW